MKKTITLAAALALTMGAYAQQESAFFSDADEFVATGKLHEWEKDGKQYSAYQFEPGTKELESENITMSIPFTDDGFKSAGIANDVCDEVTIGNQKYTIVTGIQGQTNPNPHSAQTMPNAGCVHKFEVKADGWLYVICKPGFSKPLYVWVGTDAAGTVLAYTMNGIQNNGTEVTYTLPANDEGYFDQTHTEFMNEAGTALASPQVCVQQAMGEDKMTADACGVVAFPVYEGLNYYINAGGSKISLCGFVFDKGAEEIAEISFSKSESGEAAIESVAADADDENAPVYNINGQEVSKDTKGLLIQKGKKYYNR